MSYTIENVLIVCTDLLTDVGSVDVQVGERGLHTLGQEAELAEVGVDGGEPGRDHLHLRDGTGQDADATNRLKATKWVIA